RPHRAGVAQTPGDRTRVDAADADHTVAGEVVVERAVGAEVRDDPGGVAHDVAGDPDAPRLGILVVDAGVPDVRGRHDDDLPCVARVGEGLLVSGHAGGEHRLAEGAAAGAVGAARVPAAVLEHEDRGVGVDHADASPSGV